MDVLDLKKLSVRDLLKIHSEIIDELKNREIVRTKNNPVGDYAEWLVCTMLGYTLENNSNRGFDAVDRNRKWGQRTIVSNIRWYEY